MKKMNALAHKSILKWIVLILLALAAYLAGWVMGTRSRNIAAAQQVAPKTSISTDLIIKQPITEDSSTAVREEATRKSRQPTSKVRTKI